MYLWAKNKMNPFTLDYHPDYFCDRVAEIKRLKENIDNGLNTVIHSPRRLGKTAMILQLFHKLEQEKNYETIYIDLFASNNLNDFTRLTGEALLNKYYKISILNGVKKLFKGFYVNIKLNPDGSPELDLGFSEGKTQNSLSRLFDFLEKRKKKVVIAFDEFQEVASYPEKGEAALRSLVQHSNNITFLFSGSSTHILEKMFYTARQPFYQSSQGMVLGKIDREVYGTFIKKQFLHFKKIITQEALDYLLDFSDVYTYYTQVVSNQVFYQTKKELNLEQAIELCKQYIEIHKSDYMNIYNLLAENQKKLVRAIALEGGIEKPTSSAFIQKYGLPPASSTLLAINTLLEKEILCKFDSELKVYDVFFSRFLAHFFPIR